MKPLVVVCILVTVAFLIMVTETECKAANKYDYVEAAQPLYMKKLLRASRSLEDDDEVKEDDEDDDDGSATGDLGTGRQLCCCPECLSSCTCCCA